MLIPYTAGNISTQEIMQYIRTDLAFAFSLTCGQSLPTNSDLISLTCTANNMECI